MIPKQFIIRKHFSSRPNNLITFIDISSIISIDRARYPRRISFVFNEGISITRVFACYDLVFINLLYMAMFGDMFETEEDLLSGDKGGQVLSFWEKFPKNCAHNLAMPDL